MRHPIYTAFIFVQCPGLILWLWGWPALVLPFAAYGLYRSAVRREERRLYEHFGPSYEAYRRTVPALVPRLRRRPPLAGRRRRARQPQSEDAQGRRGPLRRPPGRQGPLGLAPARALRPRGGDAGRD